MSKKSNSSGVGFFLYSPVDKKVLIHKRDDRTKDSPNKWDHFGGGIELGEIAEQTLVRELYEEVGVRIDKDGLKLLSIDDNMYYILFPKYIRELKLGEGAGFAWFSFEEALKLKNITDKAKRYLKILKRKVVR